MTYFDVLKPQSNNNNHNARVCGICYQDAIAKTLDQVSDVIYENLLLNGLDPKDETLLLYATFKNGGDGMGDVSVHKEKGDSALPDKAFRFSFALLKVETNLNEICMCYIMK